MGMWRSGSWRAGLQRTGSPPTRHHTCRRAVCFQVARTHIGAIPQAGRVAHRELMALLGRLGEELLSCL